MEHWWDDIDRSGGGNRITLDNKKVKMIIIIFINCNWVVTRWQWLFYMYTKYETVY